MNVDVIEARVDELPSEYRIVSWAAWGAAAYAADKASEVTSFNSAAVT
jgi:hypothetical protein